MSKLPTTWHQMAHDAGQMVSMYWAAAGDRGAILRVVDRSAGDDRYYLHGWLKNGVYEPWNGAVDVRRRRGRKITASEALRLLDQDD